MVKAWPRYLPDPSAEAIAHALIIEAYAIVVAELSEGYATLGEAHRRALAYAEARYSRDEIGAALVACSSAPENRLHDLATFWPPSGTEASEKVLRPVA